MWWRGFRFCVSIKLQDDETLLLREALEHNGGFACIDGVGSSPVVLRWVRAGGHSLPPQRSWHSQVPQAQSGAELELIYPTSLAPKFLGSRARRQGLQQFQTLLWTSPHAPDGCLLCGAYSYQFLKRLVHHLQGRLVCLFPCLFQRDFFPYKIHVFKISFRFFSLDSGRNWSLWVWWAYFSPHPQWINSGNSEKLIVSLKM